MIALAESMAGPVPAAAADLVVRLADGNPFMGAAVLRGMVETGALTAGADGWVTDADRMQDVQAARRSAVFLVRRLELLPDEALRLLSVGAVLGKHFDLDVAVEVDRSTGRRRDDHRERAGEPAAVGRRGQRPLAVLPRQDPRGPHRPAGRGRPGASCTAAQRTRSPRARRPTRTGSSSTSRTTWTRPDGRPTRCRTRLRGAALARERYALDSAVAHYRIAERDARDRRRRVPADDRRGSRRRADAARGVRRGGRAGHRSRAAWSPTPTRSASLECKLGELAFKTGDIALAKQPPRRCARRARPPRPAYCGAAAADGRVGGRRPGRCTRCSRG